MSPCEPGCRLGAGNGYCLSRRVGAAHIAGRNGVGGAVLPLRQKRNVPGHRETANTPKKSIEVNQGDRTSPSPITF
jgi:hypothetical protein